MTNKLSVRRLGIAAVIAVSVTIASLGISIAGPLEEIRKGANQGHAVAQVELGRRYEFGIDMPQNYAEATRWYRRAAEQGYLPGQEALGHMLWVGHGVPKNLVQAHMWLSIASGYAHDPALRSFVETERDEVALDMTPAQIAEAQKLAAGWKPTSSR